MSEVRSEANAPDLNTQLRSLALARPLVTLEAEKGRLVRDGSQLFDGIDTQYLGLSMIDWVMGESLFKRGVDRVEAIARVAAMAAPMKTSLSLDERMKIGEVIFDAFANISDNQKPFRIEYWDGVAGTMARFEFRLLDFKEVGDGEFLWQVTREGLLLHLGMLSIAPDIASELERKLLSRLIVEGRVDEAAKMAERARIEAQLFRTDIDNQILWASRGSRVDWAGVIVPRIAEARARINGRVGLDAEILKVIGERLPDAADADRAPLMRVKSIVQGSQRQHLDLDTRLNGATQQYIEFQSARFSIRLPGARVDPQDGILMPLLAADMEAVSAEADNIVRLLNRPTARRLTTLTDVLFMADAAWNSELRRQAETAAEDDLIEEWQPPQDSFPAEIVAGVVEWFDRTLRDGASIPTDELLEMAAADGLGPIERRCLALHALHVFSAMSGDVDVVVKGWFSRPEATGNRVFYTLKENVDA